jgi:hypothetical protein
MMAEQWAADGVKPLAAQCGAAGRAPAREAHALLGNCKTVEGALAKARTALLAEAFPDGTSASAIPSWERRKQKERLVPKGKHCFIPHFRSRVNSAILCQTPFMADVMARARVLGWDATYADCNGHFRNVATGYHDGLGRGVPVAIIYMENLTADAYAEAFDQVFAVNPSMLTTAEDGEVILAHDCYSVDFCPSQLKGLKAAVGMRRAHAAGQTTDGMTIDALAALGGSVSRQVAGCGFHFKQCAREVKMSRRVPKERRALFWDRVEGLVAATADSYQSAMSVFRREFPRCRRWLDWWDRADTGGTVLPGHPSAATAEERAKRPSTNNLNESGNRSSYRLSPNGKTIIEAIDASFREVCMWESMAASAAVGGKWRGGRSPEQIGKKETAAQRKKVRRSREQCTAQQSTA